MDPYALGQRPIPAYAGETEWEFDSPKWYWAYPRIRGGNLYTRRDTMNPKGLSPHTRGKLFPCDLRPDAYGPIPAYAGETAGLNPP